ncbi:sigma-70 family RNA polymerase sigma factor [Paenibacillus sp. TRM 82003]|nr:sigma-70 family RNA polymerase sigma factor [Paenibacillus sp. TRM 82003]
MATAEARLGELVIRYKDRIYRKAYGLVKDAYLAQDVTQETFLKAYRHLDSVHDEERAGAWLSKIATNAAIDLLRKRQCWNGIPMDHMQLTCLCGAAQEGVEEQICLKLGAEALMNVVHRLKPEYRDVVVLKVKYGWKDGEIADRLGVSIGTVKSRFHRAKRMIRGDLPPHLLD